ncbi:MAG: hypothetical protein P1U86_21785, partial [Verrucomicrobiales bacterium]|nr:hypothetical protein [Verrucomicrobiales bacterium]
SPPLNLLEIKRRIKKKKKKKEKIKIKKVGEASLPIRVVRWLARRSLTFGYRKVSDSRLLRSICWRLRGGLRKRKR